MKIVRTFLVGIFVFASGIFSIQGNPIPQAQAANPESISLSVTVVQYLALTTTAGATVAFGSLTPGTAIPAPATGTIESVTTNAANGYTLGAYDSATTTNSALLHTDTTTYIADYAGTITTPTDWTGTGLGLTLYAATTTKEAKWGTGTTYNDVLNKYAGLPETAATVHTVTGYHAGADTSSWAYKINVANTQKTGAYSGTMYFSATAVLS